ncbi:hypothetical protein GCM10022140_33340 [Rhodococcus aetherivorans]
MKRYATRPMKRGITKARLSLRIENNTDVGVRRLAAKLTRLRGKYTSVSVVADEILAKDPDVIREIKEAAAEEQLNKETKHGTKKRNGIDKV